MITLPPFKAFLASNIPSVYDNTLTYYEELVKLIAYLENEVVPAVNKTAGEVDGIKKGLEELKSYVDNYFENLDVQEEINNKLDEMAEGGQLAGIIAQFLEMSPVFAYGTIAEMAAADNLNDGCIARVLGNTSAADGDGAYYRIHTKGESETADGFFKVAIGDTLIAERVVADGAINVLENGVTGDGVTDDGAAIQALIDNNPLATLYFPDGNYLITQTIDIPTENAKGVSIKLDPNARIFTSGSINYLLEIGANEAAWDRYAVGNTVVIDGGIWDAENCTIGAIHHIANRKTTQIINAQIFNAKVGIDADRGTNTSNSSDLFLTNLNIFGKSSLLDGSIGLYLKSDDNKISHIRLARFQTGIYDKSTNFIEDIHVLYSEGNITYSDAQYNKTVCYIHSDTTSETFINNIHNGTNATGFIFGPNTRTWIEHVTQHWWKQEAGANYTFYKFNGNSSTRLTIVDGMHHTPATANSVTGFDVSDADSSWLHHTGEYQNVILNNLYITKPSATTPGLTDYIWNTTFGKEDSYNIASSSTGNMTANAYYPIAYLKNGAYMLEIRVGNRQIIRAALIIDSTSEIKSITNIGNFSYENDYSLAICNTAQDAYGNYSAYLCLKSSGGRSFAPSIRFVKGWNQQVFIRPGYFSAIDAPTVNDEESFNP